VSKVWLITGASRGLGRAFTEEALKAGHRVLATARNSEQLVEVAGKFGQSVRIVSLDVTKEAQAQCAVDTAIEAFGGLDVLVNNAGYGNVSPVEDTPLADFRAQIETDLFGVIIMTKAVLPYFRERASGHIIQISSIGGRVGPTGRAAYAAAKFGVEGYSESLSKEVRPLGHKGHDRGTGRLSNRICGLLHGASRRPIGVRRDLRRNGPLSAQLRWQATWRPGKSGSGGSADRIAIRTATAPLAWQ
jgi:NAD(P)-dependent dehydrogenase (short-subunit alcohol dehydrogenase family)